MVLHNTTEYYSALKVDETLTNTTLMNLKHILLSERCKMQEITPWMEMYRIGKSIKKSTGWCGSVD